MDTQVIKNYFNSGDPALVGIYPLSTGNPIERPYRHYYEARTLEQYLPAGAFSMLEFGCGAGRWAFEFAPRLTRYVGVDLSEEQVSYARKKAQINGWEQLSFEVEDIATYLARSSRKKCLDFDVVYFSGVTQYLSDQEWSSILHNLASLISETTLVVDRSTTSLGSRGFSIQKDYQSVYRTDEEILTLFEKSGFHRPQMRRSYPFLLSNRFTRSRWFRYMLTPLMKVSLIGCLHLLRRFCTLPENRYIEDSNGRYDHKFFVSHK